MQAIILAGGFGTRLQSVVNDLPKPMASVNGKPFLCYILNQLSKFKFDKVVLAVGYIKEAIISYFKDEYRGMKIVYSIEDSPLGTGGCIKKALNLIDDDYCYIINGDTYFNIDFTKLNKPRDILIACKYLENFSRYGTVEIKDGKIVKFNEKEYREKGYINGGIYLIRKNLISQFDLNDKFSLEKDFFEKYIGTLSIDAFCSDDYFIDIGIPEDYFKAQEDFKNE